MRPKATNEYEATLVRDSLYAASLRGQFPMTGSIEHHIEMAFLWGNYGLLHVYGKFLAVNYLPWAINGAMTALEETGEDNPDEVLTKEHLDAYKDITSIIIEMHGNTEKTRGLMADFVGVAFSDMNMARFIPDIVSSRKVTSENELIAILDEMRTVHVTLAEGTL